MQTNQNKQSKHTARAFLGILLTKYALTPLTILTGVLVARVLGPEERGLYGFAMLISNLIVPISLLGLQTAVNYYIASQKYITEKIFYSLCFVGVIFGMICSALIYCAWYYSLLGATGNKLSEIQILICISFIPVTTLYYLMQRIINAEGWYAKINTLDVINNLLSITLLIALVATLKYEVIGAIFAIGITKLILLIICVTMIIQKKKPQLLISFSFLKDGFLYGIKAWLGTLATLANSRLDHLFVSGFTSPSNYAFYSIAVSLAGLIAKIPMALSSVFFNKNAEQKDLEVRKRSTEQIHRIVYLLVYALGIGLMIVGPLIIPLFYGEAYKGAVIPFLIYTPVVMIYTTTRIIIYYFSSSGKPIVSSNIQLFALIAAIPCYYYFASNYGAVGAAFANIIVTLVSLSVALRYWLKQSGTSLKELFVLTSKDIDFVKQQFRKSLKK